MKNERILPFSRGLSILTYRGDKLACNDFGDGQGEVAGIVINNAWPHCFSR